MRVSLGTPVADNPPLADAPPIEANMTGDASTRQHLLARPPEPGRGLVFTPAGQSPSVGRYDEVLFFDAHGHLPLGVALRLETTAQQTHP